ncbi:hypothetical protein SLOPH_1147 [Spraguea lophii 42_110]|uniref:Uncharacterized protein n=1 Tax=Spraguea lophii (strain 42_110) TaxID=1358809 RepID=S7XHB7_SPRLO|nr:hypothetical protein SLOPH_1147 [Spraguea lophii 42_110]
MNIFYIIGNLFFINTLVFFIIFNNNIRADGADSQNILIDDVSERALLYMHFLSHFDLKNGITDDKEIINTLKNLECYQNLEKSTLNKFFTTYNYRTEYFIEDYSMIEKIINSANLSELLKENESYQQLVSNVEGKVFENCMKNVGEMYKSLFEVLTTCIGNEKCKTFIQERYTECDKIYYISHEQNSEEKRVMRYIQSVFTLYRHIFIVYLFFEKQDTFDYMFVSIYKIALNLFQEKKKKWEKTSPDWYKQSHRNNDIVSRIKDIINDIQVGSVITNVDVSKFAFTLPRLIKTINKIMEKKIPLLNDDHIKPTNIQQQDTKIKNDSKDIQNNQDEKNNNEEVIPKTNKLLIVLSIIGSLQILAIIIFLCVPSLFTPILKLFY